MNDITHIRWEALRKNTPCRYIVFDKDNTLTAPYRNEFYSKQIQDEVVSIKKNFGPNNIVILSNSAGSKDDHGHKWKREIEKDLDLKVMVH